MVYQLPENVDARPVVVIGGGTLGRRIALMFASAGGESRLFDLNEQARTAAVEYVESELPNLVQQRGDGAAVGTVRADAVLADALIEAWLVIEAVPENLELKKKVLAEADAAAPDDAIIATNSSSYPSRLMLDNVEKRDRVLNMHFYMPPQQYAIDLMSDGETDEEIIDALVEVLPRFGLQPFVARQESVGFIFNRIWAAVKRESLAVVADGVSTHNDVDEMFKINMGTELGPFQLMDAVGLDVVLDIENHYADEYPNLPEGPRRLLKEYVDAGNLGVKTGRGFYRYEP